MKLAADERAFLNDIIDEVIRSQKDHVGGVRVKDAAVAVLAELEADGSGHEWIRHLIHDAAVQGLTGRVKRRLGDTAGITGKAKSGADFDIPAYRGARRTHEGRVVYQQELSLDWSIEDARQHRADLAKTRNTVSTRLAAWTRIIEQLESMPAGSTVRDACAVVGFDVADLEEGAA